MTAVMEQTIEDTLLRAKELVDTYWSANCGLTTLWPEGKTCLLGVLGLAVYGTDWEPDYGPFDQFNFPGAGGIIEGDPAVMDVVHHIADQVSGDGATATSKVYRYNDERLGSPAEVHEFLEGLIGS